MYVYIYVYICIYLYHGSAAMLCGFKRMSMAVVLFIAECGDDWSPRPSFSKRGSSKIPP